MNLILLFENDFINSDQVRLTDRRLTHIQTIHRAQLGDSLQVGQLNGSIGSGEITEINDSFVTLKVTFETPPPSPLPVTLILALPRPKMLKRILQTTTAMGVKKIYLINSYRVEKSYWQTPFLEPDKLLEYFTLGLEQAKDTVLPEIIFEKRFKPFVEDKLPAVIEGTQALVAHPNTPTACPAAVTEPVTLVVGPEGGLIPYEVEKLIEAGCKTVHLGPRILTVETAIPVLLSKLFY